MNKLRSCFSKPMSRIVALMVILGMTVYGAPKMVELTANLIYSGEQRYVAQMMEGEVVPPVVDQGQVEEPAQDEGQGDDTWQDEGQGDDTWQDEGQSDDTWQDEGQSDDTWQDEGQSDDTWQDEGQTDTGDNACSGWNDDQGACHNYGEYIDMGDGTKCTMMDYNEPMVCEGSSDEWTQDQTTEDCTNGWVADDGRCEDYGMWNWLNDEWCVLYSDGSSECSDDTQNQDDWDQWEDDQWESENTCEGPDCTSSYQEEVCGSDGITYATEDEVPENVDTQYYGTCSTPDARELRNMQQNLKDEVDFENVLERAQRGQKYVEKMLERFAKYLAKAEEKGLSETFSAFVEEKVTLFEGYQAEIDAHIAEIESYQALYTDFLTEAQSRYDTVAAGGYGSQYFWNYTGKRDFFWIIRETLDRRTSAYDNTGMYDFIGLEPVKIAYDAERQGVLDALDWTSVTAMQENLQALRDTLSNIVDEMDVLKEEAVVALADDTLSQEDINDLRTDLWEEMDWLRWDMDDYWELEREFWDSEPWRNFELMWQSINWAREYGFAIKEFENMQAMLDQAQAALAIADGLYTEAAAQTIIDDLISIIEDKVLPAAEDAMAKAEETKNPEVLWFFFDRVMKPFGNYADNKIGYLKDLFYSKYEDQVSDEDRELIVSVFENGPRNDSRDTFVQEFEGDGADEQKIIDYLVSQIDEDMASKIIEKLMGMISNETLQNLGSYDQQMGIDLNQLLTMSTYADPTSYKDMLTTKESMASTIADMQQQIDELKIQNSQLQSQLDEMAQYNFYGDQAEAFQSTLSGLDLNNLSSTEVSQLQSQFEEVKTASESQKYEDGIIPFVDTPEGEWYAYYAGTLKNEGVISGYTDTHGNATGEYGPGNSVTNAEFLKMALNATGYGEGNGTPSNGMAVGHWAQDYYAQAEQLGLDLAGSNPNDSVNRGMVAQTINVLMGNPSVSLSSGEFNDVQPGDEFANDIAAIASAGVMTGDAAQGNVAPTFRPYDGLNRAEVAAVITRVMEGQQVTEFETFDIGDFLQELEELGPVTETTDLYSSADEKDIFVQPIETDENDIFVQPLETEDIFVQPIETNDIFVQPAIEEENFWKLNSLLNFLELVTTY